MAAKAMANDAEQTTTELDEAHRAIDALMQRLRAGDPGVTVGDLARAEPR